MEEVEVKERKKIIARVEMLALIKIALDEHLERLLGNDTSYVKKHNISRKRIDIIRKSRVLASKSVDCFVKHFDENNPYLKAESKEEVDDLISNSRLRKL